MSNVFSRAINLAGNVFGLLSKTKGGTGISSTATFPSSGTVTTDAGTSAFTNKTFDADGTGNSITNIEDADIKAGAAIARTKLASGSNNHVLINSGAGVMSSEAALDITRGGTGQTTALAAYDALSGMSALGDLTYGGASGTRTRLAGQTTATRNFLRQTGSGTVSAAPAWDTILGADVPLATSSLQGTVNYYGEGSFTPAIFGSGGTFTHNIQVGRYVRIGTMVAFQIYVGWNNTTGSPVGNLIITGLPFTSKNTSNQYYSFPVELDHIDTPAAIVGVVAELAPNATQLLINGNTDNGSVSNVLAASNTGATARGMVLSGTYFV